MILLNINEKRWYIYKEGFAENVINDMFNEYFNKLYQKDAVKWRIKEIWEKISINIPKQAIFVEKDSVLYSVNSELKFELAPEDFFEIDEVSHPILIGCFNHCYSEFKNLIKNYRNWNNEDNAQLRKTDSIANVYLKTMSRYYVPNIESLSSTLESAQCTFNEILSTSLKSRMREQVCPKIVEVYKNAILQINPVMLITRTDYQIQKIYAVTDNLEVEEVTYSLIERELDEIIRKVVPEDTDFLGNRIYNFMMLPLKNVRPCIRINKVQKAGLNATIFLTEKDIPVVCDFGLDYFYAFIKAKPDYYTFPTCSYIRYDNSNYVNISSVSPEIGMRKIQEVNKNMFNEMSCYIEKTDSIYRIYSNDDSEKLPRYKQLYKLNNGEVKEICNYFSIKKGSPEYNLIEKETANAKKQGCYSFWEISFREDKE